jgi:hypothetical protein
MLREADATGSELLFFNGIDGTTGDCLIPPMAPQTMARIALGERWENLDELKYRYTQQHEPQFVIEEGRDPNDLAQAGWGVIFAARADPKDLIPAVVRRAQKDSTLLFLGFRLDDWNFRVLFHSVMRLSEGGRTGRYGHVAVQLVPEEGRISEPEGAQRYLESYFGREAINIYWGSAEDFVRDLRSRWNGEYGREIPI